MDKLILNTDGGARGNPGPAGIGAVFSDTKGEIIAEYREYIGETTNNVAEYRALVMGLEKAKDFDFKELECRLDSELVVKQVNGEYKVKGNHLKEYHNKIKNLSFFQPITFMHVRREENKRADALVNQALDEQLDIKNR
jgi:ribonuclease HI